MRFSWNISQILPVEQHSVSSTMALMNVLRIIEAYSHVVVVPSCAVVTVLGTTFFEIHENVQLRPPENKNKIQEIFDHFFVHKMFYLNTKILQLTLTAQTGSRVSPTRNVTSHSSGIDAKNFISSARPVLFSKVDRSGSASAILDMLNTSGMIDT